MGNYSIVEAQLPIAGGLAGHNLFVLMDGNGNVVEEIDGLATSASGAIKTIGYLPSDKLYVYGFDSANYYSSSEQQQVVASGSQSQMTGIFTAAEDAAVDINNENLSYPFLGLGPNSNSVAATLAAAMGVSQANYSNPALFTPGNQTLLLSNSQINSIRNSNGISGAPSVGSYGETGAASSQYGSNSSSYNFVADDGNTYNGSASLASNGASINVAENGPGSNTYYSLELLSGNQTVSVNNARETVFDYSKGGNSITGNGGQNISIDSPSGSNGDTISDSSANIVAANGASIGVIGNTNDITLGPNETGSSRGNGTTVNFNGGGGFGFTGYNNVANADAPGDSLSLFSNSSATINGTGGGVGINGTGISLNASGQSISVAANAGFGLTGNNNVFGVGNGASVSANGSGLTFNFNGSGGVGMTGANETVNNDTSGDSLSIGANSSATVNGTGGGIGINGTGISLNASGQSISVAANAGLGLTGNNDVFGMGKGASLSDNGSGGTLNLGGNDGAGISGTNVVVNNDAAGDNLSLFSNSSATINGSGGGVGINGTNIALTASGQSISGAAGVTFNLTGSNNTNSLGSGSYVGLNSGDQSDTINLSNGAVSVYAASSGSTNTSSTILGTTNTVNDPVSNLGSLTLGGTNGNDILDWTGGTDDGSSSLRVAFNPSSTEAIQATDWTGAGASGTELDQLINWDGSAGTGSSVTLYNPGSGVTSETANFTQSDADGDLTTENFQLTGGYSEAITADYNSSNTLLGYTGVYYYGSTEEGTGTFNSSGQLTSSTGDFGGDDPNSDSDPYDPYDTGDDDDDGDDGDDAARTSVSSKFALTRETVGSQSGQVLIQANNSSASKVQLQSVDSPNTSGSAATSLDAERLNHAIAAFGASSLPSASSIYMQNVSSASTSLLSASSTLSHPH